MTDTFGNIIKVPGTASTAEVKPADILASYARLTQRGVTIKSGQGVIEAGTLLARETSSKKYVVYNNGGSGGAEVAKGVLRQSVDTADGDAMGNLVVSGILKDSLLTGVDSGALADLNARQDTANDLFVF